ncbi:MAG: hypothetical protein FWD61_10150 [Phycisphaerales bacterium]|nr:hypothetical protein [Phycisphaerales bacterium]
MLSVLAAIELHPHPLFYVLLLLVPAAAVLVVVLYFQQVRLASRRAVLALTVIRILLLVLIAILFLRPAMQWSYTRTSAGTLWFLIDQSTSMQASDPQSTPAERLHWAEALGYLSAKSRNQQLDLRLAELTVLQSEFRLLQPVDLRESAQSPPPQGAVADFAAKVAAWNRKFEAFRGRLEAETGLSGDMGGAGSSAKNALSHISSMIQTDLQAVRSAGTLRAASESLRWMECSSNMDQARRDLATASYQADIDFISHSSAEVSAATDRVAGVPRNKLAQEFFAAALTGAGPKRTGGEKLADILSRYRIRMASFADAAHAAAPGAVDPVAFPDLLQSALFPSANATPPTSTNISAGLQFIAEQIPLDEPAAIVIVTDGRHNTPGDPAEPARLLANRGVRVFGLLTGSHAVAPDAAIDQVDAPEWIFKGDTLRATVFVRLDGLAGSGTKTARVELRRIPPSPSGSSAAQPGTGTLVQSVNIPIVANPGYSSVTPINFTDQPPDGNTVIEYEARVEPLPGEINLENNRSTFRVAVKKDKLAALLIEERPRWEYRYLADLLGRDSRIKLQKVLFEPAQIEGVSPPEAVKASPNNPRPEAQILPQTAAEWQAFDLIILGDIAPARLSVAQQQFIAAAVRDKGATLITIAGQRHMPADFIDSPLAELLPVTSTGQFDAETIARHNKFGFRPALAPEGNGSVFSQLGVDADANVALWSNFPMWYWHSPFTQVKPSASAIWFIAPLASESASPPQARQAALLSTLSIGLGKSLMLASDQSWRLRQINGNDIHQRFWNNVLGWAVGSDLPAGGKFVRFGSSQPRYVQGQPIEITARVLQENLVPYTGLSFNAVARNWKPEANSQKPEEKRETQATFKETETPGYYRATLAGLPPGDIEISLKGESVERLLNTDPSVTQKTLLIKILPQLDLERRNMNTDPSLLTRIAHDGHGFALDACYIDLLAANLPEVKRTHTITENIGFFTDPAARGTKIAHWSFFSLFAALIAAEWLLRKRAGLI